METAMRRKAATDRRREIVEAAAAELLDKGLSAATTRGVTGHLGVSTGLLHHYFESWTDLRATAFELIARRDLDESFPLGISRAPDAMLAAFVEEVLPQRDDRVWRLWLDAWAEAAADPAIAAVVAASTRSWRDRLVALLRRGNDAGVLRCPDPVGAAWRILVAVDGFAAYLLAPRPDLSRAEATSYLRELVSREIGAGGEGLLPHGNGLTNKNE